MAETKETEKATWNSIKKLLNEAQIILQESKQDLEECFDLQEKQKVIQPSEENKDRLNIEESTPNFFSPLSSPSEQISVKIENAEEVLTSKQERSMSKFSVSTSSEADFLLTSEEVFGKPKTSLSTFLTSTLSTKKLSPLEAKLLIQERAVQRLETQMKNEKKLTEKKMKNHKNFISKRGWLIKVPQGKGCFVVSKRYFFVLSGKMLLYFKNGPSRRPKGTYDLTGCKKAQAFDSQGTFFLSLVIQFREPDGTYTKNISLVTPDKEKAVDWLKAIKNNISVALNKSEKDDSEKENFDVDMFVGIDVTLETKVRKNYYDILNVPPSVGFSALKKQYRKLAMELHPDKSKGTKEYEKKKESFAEISKAFSVLADKQKRKNYDLTQNVILALRLGVIVNIFHVDQVPHFSIEDSDDESQETNLTESSSAKVEDLDASINYTETEEILYVDEELKWLFWQKKEHGTVLAPGYGGIELRYVQKIFKGEEYDSKELNGELDGQCIVLHGTRIGQKDVVLRLNSKEQRRELLVGLRNIRIESSMLFKQTFDKMVAKGLS
eukprot:maker-scaffold_3-snap-gene-21.0-mRNA-1 protein AED:0.00 eAED:0.00 QI:42/1/1/1/1/1/2/258/551